MSEVRRAAPADAAQIAGVDVRAWWHAYRGFLDEQRLSERTTEQRTSDWRDQLSAAAEQRTSDRRDQLAAAAGRETWVLEVAGRIAGFVTVGASRDADAAPQTGTIAALYVDPPAQGAGAGTVLLAHAHDRLLALGHPVATLWTFEANGLARAFYERHGWQLDPSAAGDESCEWWAPAVRYRRSLG